MSLYPSLEDMKVGQMAQAQVFFSFAYNFLGHSASQVIFHGLVSVACSDIPRFYGTVYCLTL